MEADSFANRKQALSRYDVELRTLPMPCTYTLEEVHSVLHQTSADAKQKKGRTWEEVKRYIHG